MDYDTFLSFFDKLEKEESMDIGDYTLKYEDKPTIRTGSYRSIQYFRDGYMIGKDYISEYYEIGSIMPTVDTSFGTSIDTSFDRGGIKNYDKLIDYLDYLYETNIEELKRQEQEREEELLEKKREEQLRNKKLNDFLDIN